MEIRNNKPKYLWLSIVAFWIISRQCRMAILHGGEERDYNLWLRYIGFEVLYGFLILVLPIAVFNVLMSVVSEYDSTIELLINICEILYLYFGGVIFSRKLYDWKQKNIKKF